MKLQSVLFALALLFGCSDAAEKVSANAEPANNLVPGNNGFPASTGLTVYTGTYDTNNADAYVFLGDGTQHFQKVDNVDGVASFPNVALPQDVHIVLRDFGPGPDGQFDTGDEPNRIFGTTIAGYDQNELVVWRNSFQLRDTNSGDQEFAVSTSASGSVAMEGLQSATVIPINDPLVWYAVPDTEVSSAGSFRLQMRGKFPSEGAVVATGENANGNRALGFASGVMFSDSGTEVSPINLDVPVDTLVTLTTPNEAVYGETTDAALLHVVRAPESALSGFQRVLWEQRGEQDDDPTTPFEEAFSTAEVGSDLDALMKRVAVANTQREWTSESRQDWDPSIQYARTQVVLPTDADSIALSYLEPIEWSGPSIGTLLAPTQAVSGATVWEWEPALDGTAMHIEVQRVAADATETGFEWEIWAAPSRGSVRIPDLPKEILDVPSFPEGTYTVEVQKLDDAEVGNLVNYWQLAPNRKNLPIQEELQRGWSDRRTTEFRGVVEFGSP